MPGDSSEGTAAFNPFGEPIAPPQDDVAKAGEPGEGAEEGNEPKVSDKVTPTQQIAELSRKLGEYEAKDAAKDENIRAMKKALNDARRRLGEGKQGGEDADKGGAEVLYKEIRTSKDLKQEERDDMTETELKQFDEIAALKQGMNELFKAIKSGQPAKSADEGAGEGEGDDGDDYATEARAHALELAGGSKDMANLIIEEFNAFNNDGLSKKQILERVEKAAKLVPDYKPPKEQEKKRGAPIKGTPSTDPFGSAAIISEVEQSRKAGSYNL